MINNSTPAYVFIRACIFFLHYIAPLSILYCTIVLLVRPTTYRIPILIVELWLVAEMIFYLGVYLPRKHVLQRPATHPASLSRNERQELFNRCHATVPDVEGYLTKWFKMAPMAEIKRENVKEFFCWAFMNQATWGPDEDEELETYVDQLERVLGKKIEPGRGSAVPLRLTLDKVDMLHRSLLWYLCVSVVDTITFVYMIFHSFHFHRLSLGRFFTVFPFRPITLLNPKQTSSRTLSYWHRPHTSKSRLPVLFIHGIGIGLYPYVNFLAELNHATEKDEIDGEVGIIAIEIMSVSFRITTAAIGKAEMCEDIQRILEEHGWDKSVLITHSYGSVISTHLLQTPATAKLIGPVLLIDPVSFLLHLPDVAYNFTVRKPRLGNEFQLYYFGSMDMGVSHTLARHFFWSENILWKQDIQDRLVTVVLSGRDLITNTPAVGKYLMQGQAIKSPDDLWKERTWEGKSLDLLWYDNLDHAQVFDSKRDRKKLVDVVRAYCLMGRQD